MPQFKLEEDIRVQMKKFAYNNRSISSHKNIKFLDCYEDQYQDLTIKRYPSLRQVMEKVIEDDKK